MTLVFNELWKSCIYKKNNFRRNPTFNTLYTHIQDPYLNSQIYINMQQHATQTEALCTNP